MRPAYRRACLRFLQAGIEVFVGALFYFDFNKKSNYRKPAMKERPSRFLHGRPPTPAFFLNLSDAFRAPLNDYHRAWEYLL